MDLAVLWVEEHMDVNSMEGRLGDAGREQEGRSPQPSYPPSAKTRRVLIKSANPHLRGLILPRNSTLFLWKVPTWLQSVGKCQHYTHSSGGRGWDKPTGATGHQFLVT